MTVIAGLDTFCIRSIIPISVLNRIGVTSVRPSSDGSQLSFLDGTSTSIAGECTVLVSHEGVSTVLNCLVVHTVSAILEADILLGPDYMQLRGRKMILDFKQDHPIVTSFVAAAQIQPPKKIEGGDFILRRKPTGAWVLQWFWKTSPPDFLFKGVYIYKSKLKTEKAKGLFEAEVQKWVDRKFLIPCCDPDIFPDRGSSVKMDFLIDRGSVP